MRRFLRPKGGSQKTAGRDTAKLTLLHLDDDVLTDIVSLLSSSDALALSTTARRLYHVAKHQALATVEMKGPEHIIKISAYMLTDVPNRLYWLRELYVSDGAVGEYNLHGVRSFRLETICWSMAQLLQQASNLRTLTLPNVEKLLEIEPRIRLAVATLQNLVCVEFSEVGSLTLKMLGEMKCDIHSCSLRFPPDSTPVGYFHVFDHISACNALENTHTLRLKWLWRMGSDVDLVPSAEALRGMPSIRHLEVSDCHVPVYALVRAFPGVQELIALTSAPREPDVFERWHHLDHVRGRFDVLASWHLTSAVRHLDMKGILQNIPSMPPHVPRARELVLKVVHSANPVWLTLRVEAGVGSDFWMSLVKTVPRLHVLELDLYGLYVNDRLLVNLDTWMEEIPSRLSPLHAIYVRICIIVIKDRDNAEQQNDSSAKSYITEEDITRTLPQLLAQNVPSLRFFCLGFGESMAPHWEWESNLKPNQLSWWRISDQGTERKVSSMPSDTGDRIRTYLHSLQYEDMLMFDEAQLLRNIGRW